MIKINFKDFVEEYKPEVNKFNNGLLFGTSEREWDYISRKAVIEHVWTLIKEKNHMFIKHGLYVDNREGYFVTYYAPEFDNIIVEVEEDISALKNTKMKLGEYIKRLQEIEDKYGSDIELIYARDVEGNSFEPVIIGPEAVFYSKSTNDIHEIDKTHSVNAICIN